MVDYTMRTGKKKEVVSTKLEEKDAKKLNFQFSFEIQLRIPLKPVFREGNNFQFSFEIQRFSQR